MKMKNFMVANLTVGRYKEDAILRLMNAQIENSIEVGWKPNDIILLSNFDYEFMGVKAINIKLNDFCLTGSKMFGLKWLFDNNMVNDVIWAHDLDAWQNVWFDCPDFSDIGIACYNEMKYNGGSVFWRESAKDIVEIVVKAISDQKSKQEEPILNVVLKLREYKNRVTKLNSTYNVGCSGFANRYEKSIKPIRVSHFHPYNRIAWETHVLDRSFLGIKGVSDRLEKVLRKWYPELATEISEEGKKAQIRKKDERLRRGMTM